MKRIIPRYLALLFLLPTSALSAAAPDFVRDVQPIFAQHCYSCHGPSKQKSGYRLDVREQALAGGDFGEAAIVPGQSDRSPLLRYVSGDGDLTMPPGDSGIARLTAAQVATLRAWIEAGATWPADASTKLTDRYDWWSFKPMKQPAYPKLSGEYATVHQSSGATRPVEHPIDTFIRAELARQQLLPNVEASDGVLIRRLYFDLTGLPPTAEEVETFVSDRAGNKYEQLVDRLLASPRYGERWARHWLDVVHFGETHGYDKDQPRPNAWPYRDYVIRAFNSDKPYGRFIEEQLAGDALYPGTQDGIEALGFIAAGPWDLIGHREVPETKTDGKIARHLDRDDMVANTINTFCSLTAHCAQCHNHKFDPILQEDYYSLQAVFSALDRADKEYDLDPSVAAERTRLKDELAKLTARGTELDRQIAKAAGPELAEVNKSILELEKKAQQGPRPEYGWHSAISPEQEQSTWVQVDLGQSRPIERVVLAGVWDDFNGIGAGFGFPLRFRIEASDDPDFAGTPQVVAAHDLVDYLNPGTEPQAFSAPGIVARFIRVTATKLAPRKNDYIFALSELEVYDTAGKNLALRAPVNSLSNINAPVRWRRENLTDGIFPAANGDQRLADLRAKRRALMTSKVAVNLQRQQEDNQRAANDVRGAIAKLKAPRRVYAGTVYTGQGSFVGTGASGGKPRPIFLLARGNVTKPGKPCEPGAITGLGRLSARFALSADATEADRRAALAHWIVDHDNPLTWRSIVNRVWQYHFGRALVDTPNDFGRMGSLPTHPELLDWLAVWFRDDAQGSLKQLHRMIVTSATYRQASDVADTGTPAYQRAMSIDADNRLFWRQNRRKLEAEAVRDSILQVAGRLDLTMGGPSFQDFVIEHPQHSPHYEYRLHDPNDPKSHRRSVYRFLVRSQQQPWMATLDCADPSMLVDRRNQTITPLQALAQLNNGLVLVMAGHFAERAQRQAPTLDEQIRVAVRLALARNPTATEQKSLVDYAQKHGLANACRVILNLNEFVFVE